MVGFLILHSRFGKNKALCNADFFNVRQMETETPSYNIWKGKIMKTKKLVSMIVMLCMVLTLISGLSFATETQAEKTQRIMGDVVEDGVLNTGDATLILKYCSSMIDLTESQLEVGDANLDGKINTADATYILRVVAGLEEANYLDTALTLSFSSGLPEDVSVILPETKILEEGQTIVITDVAVSQGYTFEGWQSNVDNAIYPVGSQFTMPAQSVVFMARWEGVVPPVPTDNPHPSSSPTSQPGGNSTVAIKYVDSFNELDISTVSLTLSEGNNTITASDLTIPTGYELENASFSAQVTVTGGVANPSSVTVNLVPRITVDNDVFTVIYTTIGFEKVRNDLTQNYIMGNDIDLGGKNRTPFGWNSTITSADDDAFTGIFDGNGHTITGLYIDYATQDEGSNFYCNSGLFAINEGVIRNLNVRTRIYDGVTPEYGVFGDCNVGIVAGYNDGKIINCHAVGNVGALYYHDHNYGAAGGICGTNNGYVTRCSFEGGSEGFFHIGGLAGKNFGVINECYFAGGINSGLDEEYAYYFSVRYIGGICGSSQNGTIRDCYVYMTNKIAGDMAIGGMIGWVNGGSLENCYIANTQIAYITGPAGLVAGHVVNEPSPTSGLYEYDMNQPFTYELPAEFSAQVWDFNAVNCPGLPDLIKNRRGETWADSEG